MPRFLFNVTDDGVLSPQCLDLPDLKAARCEAVKAACTTLMQCSEGFWENGGDWQMTVTDERGLTLFTLIFYAADAPAGR
jgi:hypothetical protein